MSQAEAPIRREVPITPESLIIDNKSPESVSRMNLWNAAKMRGRLHLVVTCGDARVAPVIYLGPEVMTIRNIAATGSVTGFKHAANHEGAGDIIILGHYDGERTEAMCEFTGCGGLTAKEKEQVEPGHIEGDLGEYVRNHIRSHNVIAQTVLSAFDMAALLDDRTKPVLAAVTDHRTGIVYPIALITDKGKTVSSGFNLGLLLSPQKIYGEYGVPKIVEDQLTPDLQEALIINRKLVGELSKQHPELHQSQGVQNPHTIILTTEVKPAANRYAGTFGQVPNNCFSLRVPYIKEGGFFAGIDPDCLKQILAQAEYPISHAVAAKGPDDSFGRTKTVLIETPRLDISEQMANQLCGGSTTRNWLNKGGKVLIAETHSGITTDCRML